MTDNLLLEVIRAGGDRWRRLVAKAVTGQLHRVIAGCDEAFEDEAGPIEDCLLDSASAFRGLRASRGGRGATREAAAEAGDEVEDEGVGCEGNGGGGGRNVAAT